MKINFIIAGLSVLLSASAISRADTYTYTYTGPAMSGGDHLVVAFTTNAKLSASKSYIAKADAGVVSGSDSIAVISASNGTPLPNFTMPLDYGFQIHTDASGNIDAWYTAGNINPPTVNGTLNGTGWQAYTMNTMAFIPGSDIVPTPVGLVTGHYNYDQATEISYVNNTGSGIYSAIINPANTSGANWKMTVNTTTVTPPPAVAPLVLSGSLPGGTVGVFYNNALVASGGVAPYTWSATGLPEGLSIDNNGVISGIPSTAGTFSTVSVTVTDSANPGNLAIDNTSISITAAPVSCAGTDAPITFVNKWWLDLNGGLANGGQSVIYAPPAGTTFTGGTTAFLVGERVDYVGTVDGSGMCAATSMTVKPAAISYSCTKPASAKSTQAKGKITAIGSDYIVVGSTRVQTPSCTQISWNGATGFAIGQRAEYKGYVTGATTVATNITIN